MLKKGLLVFGAVLLVLIGILAVNTLRFTSEAEPVMPVTDIEVDVGAAARLAQAVQFITVSDAGEAPLDSSAFRALHAFLEASFPRVHATLTREMVGGLSLLYTWPGQDPARAPVVLMAHQDVVPIEGDAAAWTQGAFDGVIADGFIWGRGTLDDKSGLLGLLEAVEMLLADGFVPAQTVYLAFGHDEEIGGRQGAKKIAEVLGAAGYRTILSGKWHVGNAYPAQRPDQWTPGEPGWPTPTQRGFDRFYGTLDGAGSFFNPHTLMRAETFEPPETPDFYYTDAIGEHASAEIAAAID